MRVAFYPGTFDPVTFGHLDVIGRAAALFDRLVVGVAISTGKRPLLPLPLRASLLADEIALAGLSNVSVVPFEGLLVEAVRAAGAVCIVRGLRAVGDFDLEAQLSGANKVLAPEIETAFLMASPQHRATASRIVREIATLGGPVDAFVPPAVARALEAAVARR